MLPKDYFHCRVALTDITPENATPFYIPILKKILEQILKQILEQIIKQILDSLRCVSKDLNFSILWL